MTFKHNASRGQRIGKMKYKARTGRKCDALDDAGGTVVLVGAEADEARRPAALLRIETALTLGLVLGLGLRQTEGLLASVLKLMSLDLAVPDHTTLSRRASKRQLPNKRQDDRDRIPEKGAVRVLIDSTGLQIYGVGQWLEEKHGTKLHRNRRRHHLALDADSGDIIAHVMTEQDAGDASQLEVLFDQIDPPIGLLTADGAYDGNPDL